MLRMICALILFWPVIANAQRANTPPAREEELRIVVRSFDVSDLIRTNSQYPFEPMSRQFGSRALNVDDNRATANRPTTSAQIQIDPLVFLIKSTVAEETWLDRGGSVGEISTLGSIMVVRQTQNVLNQIQVLLDELRKIVGPTQVMTIRATWVMSQPNSLPKGSNEATDEWMSKQKIYCESQLTCFSGQTVHVSSGNDRLIVTDLTPVVASNAIAFDPTVAAGLAGVVMQVTPQTVPGSDEAIVDIKSVVSQQGISEQPVNVSGLVMQGTDGKNVFSGAIDRGNIVSQELRTTARVQLKKRIIVGGMTLNPGKSDEPAGQLYLAIEVMAGK